MDDSGFTLRSLSAIAEHVRISKIYRIFSLRAIGLFFLEGFEEVGRCSGGQMLDHCPNRRPGDGIGKQG